MLWRDTIPKLRAKADKDFCVDFVIRCSEVGAQYSQDVYLRNTIQYLLSKPTDKAELSDRLYKVTVIRSKEKADLKAREAAHVVLHAIETILSNTYQSASGHAARSIDALSRIDTKLSNDILTEFNV